MKRGINAIKGMFLACGLAAATAPAQAQEKPKLDMCLALMIDNSRSITGGVSAMGMAQSFTQLSVGQFPSFVFSSDEWNTQIEGIASALESREVQQAIFGGPYGRIAVRSTFFSDGLFDVDDRWVVIASPDDASRYAGQLRRWSLVRPVAGGTHIFSGAIDMIDRLKNCPDPHANRVLDIQTDGLDTLSVDGRDRLVKSNATRLSAAFHAKARKNDVTVNVLAITADPRPWTAPELTDFLTTYVRSPAGFMEEARSWQDYPHAIRRKLVQEIAFLP